MSYLLKRIIFGVFLSSVCMLSFSQTGGSYTNGDGKFYSTGLQACTSSRNAANYPAGSITYRFYQGGDQCVSGAMYVYSVSQSTQAPDTFPAPPPDPNKDAGDTCAAGTHHVGTYLVAGQNLVHPSCQAGANPCALGTYQVSTASTQVCIPEDEPCPSGQHRSSDNICSPDPVSCPGGGVAASSDKCAQFVCPAGDFIENNSCVRPSATPAPVTNPSGPCPKGTINIGTASDGTPMCKGTQTDTPLMVKNTTVTSPETTTTNADGSNTSVNKQDITNTDGSITTYTNTCNKTAAGVTACATTQSTGVASNGSSGVADGKPAAAPGTGTGNGANPSGAPGTTPCTGSSCPQNKTMCDEHPNLNVCQNSQATMGGCNGAVSTVAVTGDAIQGAILRKIADDDCANSQTTPAGTLGGQLMNGQDPMQGQINTAMTGTTVDLNAQGLDSSGFLGGSCLADRSISVAGRSVAVSFSAVCNSIGPLRFAVLACAFIVAYLLVSKSVLQG